MVHVTGKGIHAPPFYWGEGKERKGKGKSRMRRTGENLSREVESSLY